MSVRAAPVNSGSSTSFVADTRFCSLFVHCCLGGARGGADVFGIQRQAVVCTPNCDGDSRVQSYVELRSSSCILEGGDPVRSLLLTVSRIGNLPPYHFGGSYYRNKMIAGSARRAGGRRRFLFSSFLPRGRIFLRSLQLEPGAMKRLRSPWCGL